MITHRARRRKHTNFLRVLHDSQIGRFRHHDLIDKLAGRARKKRKSKG